MKQNLESDQEKAIERLKPVIHFEPYFSEALAITKLPFHWRSVPDRALVADINNLTAEQISRIAQKLVEFDDPSSRLLLVIEWTKNRDDWAEAVEIIAHSEKIWLWWPVLRILCNDPDFLPNDQAVQDRMAIIRLWEWRVNNNYNISPHTLSDDQTKLLEQDLTPKALAMSLGYFGVGSETYLNVEYVNGGDHKRAEAFIQQFLIRLLDEWDMLESIPNFSHNLWWGVDSMTRYVNHVHSVSIGGLGSNLRVDNSVEYEYIYNWKAIAQETIDWITEHQDSSSE